MKLDHSTIIVKRHMLRSPSIFPSRMTVLAHLLFREPFAFWGSDGKVHVADTPETNPRKAVMTIPKNLQEPLDFDKDLKKLMPDFYKSRIVDREMQIMQLKYVEANIDTFAAYTFDSQRGVSSQELTALSMNPLIFNIPDNVESSWKKACGELVEAVIKTVVRDHFMHHMDINDEKNWDSSFWFKMFEKFSAVREQLQTRKKAIETLQLM